MCTQHSFLTNERLLFAHPYVELCKRLCGDFQLEYSANIDLYRERREKHISIYDVPVTIRDVCKDGNCLYRSIRYAISGTEGNYYRLKHLAANELDSFGNTYLKC